MLIKLTLNPGVESEASQTELAIKAKDMDLEARKGKGGTWNLHVLFNLGCVEWREETQAESQVSKGRSAGLSSSASLIYKVFTPVSEFFSL